MSLQNTIPETQNSTASNYTINSTTYYYAAGVHCLLPMVNHANSPHKCFFCKRTLHGPCGVHEAKQRKRVRVTHDTEALTKAVSSLAASQEEQEQRVQLLVQQKNREKGQEKWDFQSWKCSECEICLEVYSYLHKLRKSCKRR
jgi:hypothetical protein